MTLVLDFSIAWIKYKFGIFDEHGLQEENEEMYPKFYRRRNNTTATSASMEIWPNSCANAKIRGNFTEACLQLRNQHYCSFERDQEQIVSSILFSKDKYRFPKVLTHHWGNRNVITAVVVSSALCQEWPWMIQIRGPYKIKGCIIQAQSECCLEATQTKNSFLCGVTTHKLDQKFNFLFPLFKILTEIRARALSSIIV